MEAFRVAEELECGKPVQDGCLERDPLVGVAMVGGEVLRGDMGRSSLLERRDERIVGQSESVIGGQVEDRAVNQLRCKVRNVPGIGIGNGFFGEALRRAASKRSYAFICKVLRYGIDRPIAIGDGEGLNLVDGHVGGGDEADGLDGGVLRAGITSHEAAHAVADKDDLFWINSKACCVAGIAKIRNGGVNIFDGMGEGEVAGRTPASAVVEVEHIVPGTAQRLGDIEVLLVAWESM